MIRVGIWKAAAADGSGTIHSEYHVDACDRPPLPESAPQVLPHHSAVAQLADAGSPHGGGVLKRASGEGPTTGDGAAEAPAQANPRPRPHPPASLAHSPTSVPNPSRAPLPTPSGNFHTACAPDSHRLWQAHAVSPRPPCRADPVVPGSAALPARPSSSPVAQASPSPMAAAAAPLAAAAATPPDASLAAAAATSTQGAVILLKSNGCSAADWARKSFPKHRSLRAL
jgi:hypothetical protein